MKAVIITPTEHRNLQVSDCFNEACTRKYVKREMLRRWPEWTKELSGNFKIELRRD